MKVFFGVAVLVGLSSHGALAQSPRVPVLVELFTSEGCSSCPPADALLETLQRDQPVNGAEIIPIGLHVDYFNRLGWTDPFSAASFTSRQQDYSQIFGEDSVYTPQIVVDGRAAVVGSDRNLVRSAIVAAVGERHLPLRFTTQLAGETLRMRIDLPGAPTTEKIQVMAAITQDSLTSIVERGENTGRTLHHVAVARTIQRVGLLTAEPVAGEAQLQVERSWGPNRLKAVVWLQGVKSRRVYGAAIVPITGEPASVTEQRIGTHGSRKGRPEWWLCALVRTASFTVASAL